MRKIDFSFAWAVALAAVIASAACSNTAGSTAGTGSQTAADAAVNADSGAGDTGGGADSGQVATDTITGDTAANEVAAVDVVATDVATVDAADSAHDGAQAAETTAIDVVAEVSVDTFKPDTPPVEPAKCKADADCPKGFGDCITGLCEVESGKCKLKIASDGAACKTAGVCGGTGKCAQGACEVVGACAAANCALKPLKCGDKLEIDIGKLPTSAFSAWPCAGAALAGGELIYALASDVTMAAVVELAQAASDTAIAMVIGSPVAGQCSPTSCIKAGAKFTVGLAAGVTQIIAVDTKAGATGSLTVSVTCSAPQFCGDKVCTATESCSGCPADCGACKECGDKKCDAASENCGSCAADCGPCAPDPPSCVTKDTPGCAGCACEKCVCDADKFCCETAWDGACVSACQDAKCGGTKCPTPVTWCGDSKCNGTEKSSTCPADCGVSSPCGDGWCYAKGGETCSGCPIDCGTCGGGPVSGCGNGKCDAGEHCGVCPKDCGVCSADCAPTVAKSTPGCPGCACEAAVCAKDPFCCKTAWDNLCVQECQQENGSKCPSNVCGDTVCSGAETCESCLKDCGACACGDGKCQTSESDASCPADCVKCGDGKCSAGESASSCPSDCDLGSCQGFCGKKSETPNKKACYCDDQCEGFGDCCPDKATFCP